MASVQRHRSQRAATTVSRRSGSHRWRWPIRSRRRHTSMNSSKIPYDLTYGQQWINTTKRDHNESAVRPVGLSVDAVIGVPLHVVAGYSDDLRLAHVLADGADDLTMRRFRALDLHVETKPDLTPVSDA